MSASARTQPVRANVASRRWVASARTRLVRADATRVRADASVLPPGNFITDATVRPSHGRPSGHRPIVRPRDNAALMASHFYTST
jgi:hypothetical protein